MLGLATASGVADAADRCALVIANGAYEQLPSLTRPAYDARLVAHALQSIGFDVTSIDNATTDQLAAAFDGYCGKSPAGSVALVYYAGHGIQVQHESYMIPTDAKPRSPDARLPGIPVSGALGKLRAHGRQAAIFIHDASRENRIGGSAVSVDPVAGIPARPNPGVDEVILWSTSPGSGLADTAGDNGPFALSLSNAAVVPGLSLDDMAGRVRGEVAQATNGRQVPWSASSLSHEVMLVAQ